MYFLRFYRDCAQTYAAAAGLFLPFLAALLTQTNWSSTAKRWTIIALAALAIGAGVWFEYNPGGWLIITVEDAGDPGPARAGIITAIELWLDYRRVSGRDLPYYQHGNDSGWDNSTTFDLDRVIESPDLAALLVVQLDVLAGLAEELGLTEPRWAAESARIREALLSQLWRGQRCRPGRRPCWRGRPRSWGSGAGPRRRASPPAASRGW